MKTYTKKNIHLLLSKILHSLKKKKTKNTYTYPNIKTGNVFFVDDILFPGSIIIDIHDKNSKKSSSKIIGKIEICLSTIMPMYSIRKLDLNDPEENGLYRGHNKLLGLYESFNILYNEIIQSEKNKFITL